MDNALLKDVLEILLEETRARNKVGNKGTAIQVDIWVEVLNKQHSGPVTIKFMNRIDESTYVGNEKPKVAVFSDLYEVLQYELKQPDQGNSGRYFYDIYTMLIKKIR